MSRFKISDHYNGKQFYNLTPTHNESLYTVLKWKLTSKRIKWPHWIEDEAIPLSPITADDKSVCTWVGHACFLIQLKGMNILTDPVYAKRASPVQFAGPKRVRAAGIPFESLPKIDLVLVSHNHYDHLDLATLKKLHEKDAPHFIVALGDKKLLVDNGISSVQEMDWWEETNFKETKIHFLPSQHWSARGLHDKCHSLWGGHMISQGDHKIYFGGDSGYSDHFLQIKNKIGTPDISLIPIGAYEPRWFMKDLHMNPDDAVKAHLDLGSKKSLAMHYGTFQLTDEAIDDPLKDLSLALEKYGVSDSDFMSLKHGGSFHFKA